MELLSTVKTASEQDGLSHSVPDCLGGSVCKRLGMVNLNHRESRLVEAAKRFAGVASSLYMPLWLPQTSAGWLTNCAAGIFWDSMSTMGDGVRETVAAPILRRD